MEALTCLIKVFCSAKRAQIERIRIDPSVIALWDRCGAKGEGCGGQGGEQVTVRRGSCEKEGGRGGSPCGCHQPAVATTIF